MAVQAEFHPDDVGFQDYWVGMMNPVPAFEPDFGFCSLDRPPQHTLFSSPQEENMGGIIQHFGIPVSCSSSSSTCDSLLPMAISQSLDSHLQMQKHELDYILQFQNERLRSALQCQRKQHLTNLLKNMEAKAFYLIKQKEDDLVRARSKTMELEAYLKKTEMETESWKRLASTNEAIVMDLSKSLEQIRENLVMVNNNNNTAEDAESCFSCDDESKAEEEDSSKNKIACKNCYSGTSCVLFLPCRHLCSCKNCEGFLGSCPVCKSVKEASMEVFWV